MPLYRDIGPFFVNYRHLTKKMNTITNVFIVRKIIGYKNQY
jgi:hypothetical protein